MATGAHPRPLRPAPSPRGTSHRYSRSSLYISHTPTLEPMVDEEAEDDEADSPPAPSTPSSEPSPGREPSSTSSAEDSAPAFQVSPSPRTGGVGLFATRMISRGALILSEAPLFTLPSKRTNSTVMSALSQRTREEQRDFFALWNAFKAPRKGHPALLPALGIFETNALPCGSGAGSGKEESGWKVDPCGSREGVFLHASRLNHSCRPNVCRWWDAEMQEMRIRALCDIEQDEELVMSYVGIDILKARVERLTEIEEALGFVCTCEACMLEGEECLESDRKRAAVRRLFEEIGQCGKEPTLGMRKVKLALRLLQEEQLVHYEASFCFDAFQFCVLVSDFANAKAWVRKAWEAACNSSGPDSPTARTFKMYWANPRTHQLAGVLPRMTLSGPEV
ncbi:SET domain-containing protein [Lentinus tigrinus ALCF2SS1-7]|uniref:SET domain-containing protein n=1 Tax=Lentinus tigrinus ALCF2SS1-6 TaxID=1328759 RepID=A0A5C2RV74_9APHY|nr:SET domain-containing protein [Lentinus tigrinus ALCF2SS1-6]RPD74100.1 SET domain-containing protein [Lentinus tigrinus ALCF2SS1-7]